MRLVKIMDKIELQRLLDGELDHEQRRLLLCQLDQQPTQWRTVALAMLEDQAFQRELKSMGQLSEPMAKTQTVPSMDPVRIVAAKKPTVSEGQKSRTLSDPFMVRWGSTALAASLLVGIGIGGGNWLAQKFESKRPSFSATQAPSVAVHEAIVEVKSPSEFRDLKPVGQLRFARDESPDSKVAPLQLPLFEAAPDQITQMLQMQQRQMQALNEQLRRRGFELDLQSEMLESRLPDGRAVIVPVQQVNVRSIGQ